MARGRSDRSAGLIDMVGTGMSYEDLGALTDLKRVDATPDMPEHAAVYPGDVWQLGDHRLACGDSTDPATVRALLGVDRPHLMITDPPYGVDYSPDWRNHAFRSDGSPIAGRAVGSVQNDLRVDWSDAWRLFPGDVAYVWHASRYGGIVLDSLERNGLLFRSHIVWNKSRFVIGRGDYHFKHECAWYCVRKGAKGHWNAGRDQTTVWDIAHTTSESGHGTQKPVECMRRPILNNSQPGDSVYEPFCGSGTTIIAAEETGRRCLAVELNPLYVYVAVARWQNYIGRPATLAGEPFAEVVRRRRDGPDPDRHQVKLPEPEPVPDEITADFDPVLAEVIIDRYCQSGGSVMDAEPNEVRRRVAEHLRREYLGAPAAADLLLFTADDVSGVRGAVDWLRDDRFAVAVAADRRGGDGFLAGYPAQVAAAFAAAGLRLYDELIYDPGGRPHHHVLVFVKGDIALAKEACEEI